MKTIKDIFNKAKGKKPNNGKMPKSQVSKARKFIDSISTRAGLEKYQLDHTKPINKKK